jgi:FkbM family methyltransferase
MAYRYVKKWLGAMGRLGIVPRHSALALCKLHRGFRYLVAPGADVLFDRFHGDLRIYVDTRYPIERDMLTGCYDPATLRVIQRVLKDGEVAVDVGANVGALTLPMAKIVGSAGQVVAVEPGPETYRRLLRNLEMNPSISARVHAFPVGLGEKAGDLFWREDPVNLGNAGLLGSKGVRVPVRTLDELVGDLVVTRIDFIKIDVEGMELEVLKGAQQTTQKFRPVVYYESLEPFAVARGFDLFGEIRALLEAERYRLFGQNPDQRLVPLDSLDRAPHNTLAVPHERMVEIVEGS